MTPLLVIADVSGTGSQSDVAAGAWLTLVLPLAVLALVLTWWWLAARRGWPKLPHARRHTPAVGTPPAPQAPAPRAAPAPAPTPQAPTPHAPAPQREPPPRDGDA